MYFKMLVLSFVLVLRFFTNEVMASDLKIGVVRRSGLEEDLVLAGARAVANELRSEGGPELNIESRLASDETEASNAIKEFTSEKVKGIMVSYSPESSQDAIRVQTLNGIPAVIYGGYTAVSGVVAVFGTDNYLCGQRLMDTLATEIESHGMVAQFLVAFVVTCIVNRVKGARDEQATKFRDIQIAKVAYGGPDTNEAANAIQDVFSAYPRLNGWLMVVNYILPVATPNGNQSGVKWVSADPALDQSLDQIKEGKARALLVQSFNDWANDPAPSCRQVVCRRVITTSLVPTLRW